MEDRMIEGSRINIEPYALPSIFSDSILYPLSSILHPFSFAAALAPPCVSVDSLGKMRAVHSWIGGSSNIHTRSGRSSNAFRHQTRSLSKVGHSIITSQSKACPVQLDAVDGRACARFVCPRSGKKSGRNPARPEACSVGNYLPRHLRRSAYL